MVDYIECLQNYSGIIIDSNIPISDKKEHIVKQNLIQSKKHQVSSVIQTKIALSAYDDKRYLLSHSFETLPWGHYLAPDYHPPSRGESSTSEPTPSYNPLPSTSFHNR